MTEEEFRAAAKIDFLRLLKQWTIIEYWLKRAEQVNGAAVIPAINELRYASRQFFNAHRLVENSPLSESDRRKISLRLHIAEQYLYNAEHDIADAVVSFYHEIIRDVDARFGRNVITSHFPSYPSLRAQIKLCEELIADARGNYEARGDNYRILRDEHLPIIFDLHDSLIDAQVSAQEEILRTQQQVALAVGRANLTWWLTILGNVVGFLAVILAFYMWLVTPERYCSINKGRFILNLICSSNDSEEPTQGRPAAPAVTPSATLAPKVPPSGVPMPASPAQSPSAGH